MEENKKVTENDSTKERIQINIDNTDDALNWLERLLKLLQEYGPWKILGATCLITVVSAFLYFTLNFNKALEILKSSAIMLLSNFWRYCNKKMETLRLERLR